MALCGVAFVACGLKVSKVVLSTHEPEQDTVLTVETSFVRAGDYQGEYYMLYGVRVPNDWSCAQMLTAVNNYSDNGVMKEGATVEFKESESYAALLELCYPRNGYKWIAFQSLKKHTFTLAENSTDDNVTSTVGLRVGTEMGDYSIDIVAGGWETDPSLMLDKGKLVLNAAFGMNTGMDEANQTVTVDGVSCYKTSEYLMNCGTLSAAEISERSKALLDEKVTITDKNGTSTKSISPYQENGLSDDEIAALNLNVKVVENAGVESVSAEDVVEVKDAGNGMVEVFGCGMNGAAVKVYDMAGALKAESVVASGYASVNAGAGACVVVVNNGGNRVVKKVVVK